MKNEKVEHYIGWAVMIFIVDHWGYTAYYTDIAAKILDTRELPESAVMASFEREALRVSYFIADDGRTEEANTFAEKILSGEFPEPLIETQVQKPERPTERDCKGMYSGI